jgi:hypothetical protein
VLPGVDDGIPEKSGGGHLVLSLNHGARVIPEYRLIELDQCPTGSEADLPTFENEIPMPQIVEEFPLRSIRNELDIFARLIDNMV